MRARLVSAALAALVLLPAASGAVAAPEPRISASALAVLVRAPGQDEVRAAWVAGPPAAAAVLATYAYPGDASLASLRDVSADVRRSPGAGSRVQALLTIQEASILDGAVELTAVSLAARAAGEGDRVSGDLGGSSIGSVSVLGTPVALEPNLRVPLGDWGYVVLLEQAVVSSDAAGPAYRGFATAAHVYLTAAHAGLPAGSEILVGYAEAAASAPAPPPAAPPPAEQDRHDPVPPPPGAPAEPPLVVRDPPPGVRPDITGGGYVFPVYGPASFSDDFAAPRAATGWHHGTDLFAPVGSPVLAVADGTVFSVGWNPVGGWRLWLRDGQGNEYYYAHLSAYSPLAVAGAAVRAGAVLGFVGASGDARGTPPHLHFEVHPAALLGLGYDGAIDPYPYLLAWEGRRDAVFAAGPAPEPGAVLLEVDDISTASGLVPGALGRALGLFAMGYGFLPPAGPPVLVGAAPGFARLW